MLTGLDPACHRSPQPSHRVGLHQQLRGIIGRTTARYDADSVRPDTLVHNRRPVRVADSLGVHRAASKYATLVFPVHPRTRGKLDEFGLWDRLEAGNIRLLEPMGYIEFMGLVRSASLVITDSGGLQEETTYLGIPCITLRPNTERPATITEGTNQLVKPDDLLAAVPKALGIFKRQHEGDGDQRPDTVNQTKLLRLGVFVAQFLDLFVVGANQRGELTDLFK